jgi:hypothetical protein
MEDRILSDEFEADSPLRPVVSVPDPRPYLGLAKKRKKVNRKLNPRSRTLICIDLHEPAPSLTHRAVHIAAINQPAGAPLH